jgi:DNA primase
MAGRIPQSFVDDLLSRVDIIDYIHTRVPLKKAGKNYQACCPFHDEKTPSFSVNPQKQFYYCFGCGAGGNVIGFAMDFANLSFPESVEQLAGEVGLEVPKQAGREDDGAASLRTSLIGKLKAADEFYRKQLRTSTTSIEYLKNRGLSGEIARDFGLGVAPLGWDNLIKKIGQTTEDLTLLEQAGLVIKNEDRDSHYDRFRDRIIFPIRDTRGRTIGFGGRVFGDEKPKYLNSPETPVFHKSRELYGLYEALQHKGHFEEMIVVEGYMDVIALAQQGIKNSAATLGTSVGSTHLEKLFRYVGRIIFCFDGDEAGSRAAERALHAALPLMMDGRQVQFLFLPQGEDPDSIVLAEGKEGFDRRLEQAKPLSRFMMELAGAGSELPDPDSRARAHAQAMPLINQLPRGAFRTLMEQELLTRTGVAADAPPAIMVEKLPTSMTPSALEFSASEIDSEAIPEDSVEAGPRKLPKRVRSKTSVSLPAHLTSLLLQFPRLADQVKGIEKISARDQDEQLFLDLFAYLQGKSEITLSSVLGYWMARESEQATQLTELASRRLVTNQSIKAATVDFEETLSRWTSRQNNEKLRENMQILGRIPHDQQSAEQKAEMRELMTQLRSLNS